MAAAEQTKCRKWSIWRATSAVIDEEHCCVQLESQLHAGVRKALVETREIQPSKAEEQYKKTLQRFLRAEGWDVGKAKLRLEQHVQWRLQHQPCSITESEVRSHLEPCKALVQAAGAKGRPLLVSLARNHYPSSDFAQLEKYIVYAIEAASQYCWNDGNPDNKLYILCDLSNLALKNLDASALRACFAVLHRHYPERAAGILMYKAPAIFSGLWRAVSPFIDPATRKKVLFVSGEKAQQVLEEWVGMDIVPKEYGGQAEAVPVHVALERLRQQEGRGSAKRSSSSHGAAPIATEARGVQQTCRLCAAGECRCGWDEVRQARVLKVVAA
ncbi:hypothetical protein N2152v2_010800 [Parachlorella kessleri]